MRSVQTTNVDDSGQSAWTTLDTIGPERAATTAQAATRRPHRASPAAPWAACSGPSRGTGVQAAVQLLAIMALGRLLTPTEFGLMSAAAVVVAFSQIVSQIGVGPAIIQRKKLETVHIRVAVTLSMVLGGPPGRGAVLRCAGDRRRSYRIPELEPILPRRRASSSRSTGSTRSRSPSSPGSCASGCSSPWTSAATSSGTPASAVVLAWLGFGVWALVIANLAQLSLRTLAMYLAVRHTLRPSLDLRAGKGLLSFGAGHSMAQIGTLLSQQGDNMVVGRWLGPAPLGIYGRAYNLMVMPATVFGRIVNRVLFPVMAQVQNERHRLVNAYERAVAVVALVSLPTSAFLWVVAPEFIPIVLGPAWGEVVLPFRLFTISLLFRMGSKISQACIKATGQVYALALFQFVYAGLVVGGAIIGQRWGVGGVAICVSFAMACDWLNTAYLGRSVTGLTWVRFLVAHTPGMLLAVLIGVAAEVGAEAGRWAHLGHIPVLLVAALAALAATAAAAWLYPAVFLGPHGIWAQRQAKELVSRGARRGARAASVEEGEMAGVGGGSSK